MELVLALAVTAALAGVAVALATSLAISQAKELRAALRERRESDRHMATLILSFDERLRELRTAEDVVARVKRTGVGPYLPAIVDIIADDVDQVAKHLGLNHQDAVDYLVGRMMHHGVKPAQPGPQQGPSERSPG